MLVEAKFTRRLFGGRRSPHAFGADPTPVRLSATTAPPGADTLFPYSHLLYYLISREASRFARPSIYKVKLRTF